MMDETRKLPVAALRVEFSDDVDHLAERLANAEDGKPKIINESRSKGLYRFLRASIRETFPGRGACKPGWFC